MSRRGAFIVFEGLDRSGKSTQAKRLAEQLASNGTQSSLISFPDRTTPIGGIIDSYLKGTSELDDAAAHLLFSANRWEKAKSLRTRLESGETIVADRYAYSGAAFTAAKGKLSLEWCKAPDKGLPRPDVVIFLDIDPEVAKRRGDYGAERYEKLEFQEEVRRKFDMMRADDSEGWELVDASKTPDEVAEIVQNVATKTMAKVALLPLKDLYVKDEVATMSFGFAGLGFGRTSS